MKYSSEILNIIELKTKYPNINFFRNIRYCDKEKYCEIIDEINGNENLRKKMKEEYFPSNVLKLCGKEINYNSTVDSNINQLLVWGCELILLYSNELNLYLKMKKEYESYFFKGNYKKAEMTIDKIEKNIMCSVWGKQQKLLIWELTKDDNKTKNLNVAIEKNCSSNCAALAISLTGKLVDTNISYEKYNQVINNLLDSGKKNSPAWRYFDYKFSIDKEKSIQGIKIALITDEQISLIDFFETYIDSLIYLYDRNQKLIIENIVGKIYKVINDYRIRNMYISFIDPSVEMADKYVCNIIEAYTSGEYSLLEKLWDGSKGKFLDDFVICNLIVKSGIEVLGTHVYLNKFWQEIKKLYDLSYDSDLCCNKILEYYKVLYNTSWRYKILSILTRKFNFEIDDGVVRYSLLHDFNLTPNFYRCISRTQNKLKYLMKFEQLTPVTYEFHKYLILWDKNIKTIEGVDIIRKNYYEIKKMYEICEYNECIVMSYKMLEQLDNRKMYYQERIRRLLFNSLVKVKNYYDAMQIYVSSYLLGKNQVTHMNAMPIVEEIEDSEDSRFKSTICRPIFLSLYYKNDADEIISSYLDYLESTGNETIIEYLDSITNLDSYQVLFLENVCTPKLLLKDYVSKALMHGSALELRSHVLKKLVNCVSGDVGKYMTELNDIYKRVNLKKKMDSFNRSRIFIDRDNLCKFLINDITNEFNKYNLVQEILEITKGNKNLIGNSDLFFEDYWDKTKFFEKNVEKIKMSYLSESPYSLEGFLSTRIRHNYCNDKLKRVFDEQNIFSKKATDGSNEYIINEYWQSKMNNAEYEIIKGDLAVFSKSIDAKIQEIKDFWIRIKKDQNSPGMFDYLDFTYNFINYVVMDFNVMLKNPSEFIEGVIIALDEYTNKILELIRTRIENELAPYYYNSLLGLEEAIKDKVFDRNIKSELLRKIETCKAKYIEDINGFKDIFWMDKTKYPDFLISELIDFCLQIERDMNKDFEKTIVSIKNGYQNRFQGYIFPYLVDIIGILFRNAVQHSKFNDLSELKIELVIDKIGDCVLPEVLYNGIPDNIRDSVNMVINIKNNLSKSVNENEVEEIVHEIIDNISNGTYLENSNSEGGSGLYKIAKLLDYNLKSSAVFLKMILVDFLIYI